MADILIDGCNFMGIAHKNLEKARSDLIHRLGAYAKSTRHAVTVIFDGWKDGRVEETRERIGGVTVIYSRLGVKADQVIKNMVSSATKPWIVVSSDREIYSYAEKKYSVALTRDEFEAKLDAHLHFSGNGEVDHPVDNDDADRKGAAKKGNPRRLSKKERRKLEATKKL